MVTEKLSSHEALSDPTLAVVVALIHYDRLQGQFHQGMVHFKGLQQLVQLRGGITQLRRKPAIAQKIFRADLEFALQLGSRTWYNVEDVPGHEIISSLREESLREYPVRDSRIFRRLNVDFQDVLFDVLSLAWLLNATSKHANRLDGFLLHETITLLGYRIIHLSPLGGSRPVERLENKLHLGLITFVATFLLSITRKLPEFCLLSRLLRSAAQEDLEEDEENQEVLLWTLFLGRASIFKKSDDSWLIPRMTEITSALGYSNWKDISRTLRKFPWVNALHDRPGQALWQKTVAHLCFPTGFPGNQSLIWKSTHFAPSAGVNGFKVL
ncbi:uncharacterized protein Z518_05715 [Rhinocladiella mackenziei CBS 650.93]|uniref:Transcription factor domain-containing protein n=1 Tax=Rhinocladiella mackenziei CBS 650.93 TaxID=1442369 RepID=A0A0D2IGD6_9EURO|nr:uncharacterized protein Z518_05715 [Rhinocladiella mackenziei CBS 650.93]KIX04844.1 hypothetical protein Z518_05715 [Rhinocladiella mackenziei CBS 650.93]